jgi:hypothetical protein
VPVCDACPTIPRVSSEGSAEAPIGCHVGLRCRAALVQSTVALALFGLIVARAVNAFALSGYMPIA